MCFAFCTSFDDSVDYVQECERNKSGVIECLDHIIYIIYFGMIKLNLPLGSDYTSLTIDIIR